MVRSLANRTFQLNVGRRAGPRVGLVHPGVLPAVAENGRIPSDYTLAGHFKGLRVERERGRLSACLSGSPACKLCTLANAFFYPKMRFSIVNIQGDENMVSRKNARQGASKNSRILLN